MTTAPKKVTSSPSSNREEVPVLWFEEFGIADVPIVGGKNASLGEMIRHLAPKGIRIPNGFATTAQAYRRFLKFNGLDVTLRDRKSTRLNSSHLGISYAVFCLK